MAGAVLAGCTTVHRYDPEDEAASPWQRRPAERRRPDGSEPRRPSEGSPTEGLGFGAEGALGEALGDGSVTGELLAGARRLVGLRFGDPDATLAAEQTAFEAHLAAVALWSGGLAAGRGERGELWVGPDGSFAVIEAALGGGRWRVIGPADGMDGVRVRLREVSGGVVRRALGEDVAG